ncbi:hypothetical protein CCR96_09300 [Halochromatium roseum]|nr:hypothetical protein [Halochromatium roseum]
MRTGPPAGRLAIIIVDLSADSERKTTNSAYVTNLLRNDDNAVINGQRGSEAPLTMTIPPCRE